MKICQLKCRLTVLLAIAATMAFNQNVSASAVSLNEIPAAFRKDSSLPSATYFRLLEAGLKTIQERFAAEPSADLDQLEAKPGWSFFPAAILIPTVLYKKAHPSNTRQGDTTLLSLAIHIGDLLADDHEKGKFIKRMHYHWETYMWLECYRLLENKLGQARKDRWKKAMMENLAKAQQYLEVRKDYVQYNAPFLLTSPNHYSIYAATVLMGAKMFNKPQWEKLATFVLRRYCREEQSPEGFWGEFDRNGPATGYNYVTTTQIALYWELTHDPEALKALRRSTDFHKHFTYPDGTPVETINDRNRYWPASVWGHFGFSHFPDGRRYANFLAQFFPAEGTEWTSWGRVAQDALYFHDGPMAPMPLDQADFVHAMNGQPAGIRKTGPWITVLSGLTGTPRTFNKFFLDRQGNFSVFYKNKGLIITGANSKYQPELATLSETMNGNTRVVPMTSGLKIGDTLDRLGLTYDIFFATLEVARPTEKRLRFSFKTVYKAGDADAQLNLQLVLKAGERLETGGGKSLVLGKDSIDLDANDLGGWIRHRGWTLQMPPGTRLRWPVFPYNPYAGGPETELDKAVGALSATLWSGMKEKGNQAFPFTIDIE